ncbi:CGNR zinc finger domain-containing protein [Streptomyces sp. G-G2]|uniref:CGNR zinc finger domain-containing protein n=1 Tax=Streptomyces sp. G-G2 TaxID=3046201 RepID=UPI0024B9CFB7|nr:CGNR zinc finger domain-containing protein [Streptomyces sp. G-G2]MDJ0379567.1 CGNR zinc finger domain-containing protein [Streptomyces sp. G-G2]
MWFESGRICLDLVATLGPPEGIADCAGLGLWLSGAGLVPGRTPPAHLDSDWLEPFRSLRTDVGALVAAELRGRAPGEEALARVNARASGPPPALCAVRDPGGHLVRELCGGAAAVGCAALLAAVARDAVELLTDPGDRDRLRACEGEGCTRVYLDTSRGHRRRWCSSELCGNRERVARHRARVLAARPA